MPEARASMHTQVELVNYTDSRFSVRHAGMDLPSRVFDMVAMTAQAKVVDNKRPGEAPTLMTAR